MTLIQEYKEWYAKLPYCKKAKVRRICKLVCVVLLLVVTVVLLIPNSRWEKDFIVIELDFVSSNVGKGSYKEYSITNNTNRTIDDVVLVFECEGFGAGFAKRGTKWKYEQEIRRLDPHETEIIKVYTADAYEDAVVGYDVAFLKIKSYNKR